MLPFSIFTSIRQLYFIALLIAIGMFKIFDIPIYTARDNLYGIIMLIFMYGFAMIPMVHLGEKLFRDASMANMYILCLNIIIALSLITVILLFDVLGDSDVRLYSQLICVFYDEIDTQKIFRKPKS